MRRLLWKEWQERRVWIALWLLTGVVATALGKGQSICDIPFELASSWMMIILLMALLTGLGGYGSELRGGRATFLYSRAVGWKQILAAKLLLGLAAVIVSVLLNAAAGYLFLPAEYHRLITLHSVLNGAYLTGGLSALAFVLGLAGSLVLPGLAGGLLVVVGWVVVITLLAQFGNQKPAFGPILLLLAPLLAGLLLARFGITLQSVARLRRFAFVVLILGIVGAATDYTPTGAWLSKTLDALFSDQTQVQYYNNAHFSPGARFLYAGTTIKNIYVPCLIRLSDGRFSFVESPNVSESRWLDNVSLIYLVYGKNSPDNLVLMQWQGKKPRSFRIKDAGYQELKYLALSPDGHRLLIGGYDELKLCNLATGQTRAMVKANRVKLRLLARREPGKLHGLYWCWWQTNDTVGYLDPYTRKRVLVQLSVENPEGMPVNSRGWSEAEPPESDKRKARTPKGWQ
ncbi:MAG: hypothetical protein ACYDCO_12475 [Armatimonadota bacterium]